jgi:hypothetical protein
MWTIIIGIIVDLLVKFLTDLFKNLLNYGTTVDSKSVGSFDVMFYDRVRSRWWLGPRRMEIAAQAYSRMLGNLDGVTFRAILAGGGAASASDLAALACAGVKEHVG